MSDAREQLILGSEKVIARHQLLLASAKTDWERYISTASSASSGC